MATFSRFSVYIAAVIIFVSWLINSTFVRTLEADTQTMDALQSEQTQIRQFSNLADTQRVLLRRMAAMEDSLGKLHGKAKQTEAEEQDAKEEVDADWDWIQSFQSDSSQLAKDAEELEDLAGRIQLPQDIEQAVESTIERAHAFDAEVRKEADAYNQERQTDNSLASGANETTAEELKKRDEQLSAHYARINKKEDQFDKLSEELVSLYEKVVDHITEKRQRSAERAEVASIVAYIFYAIGTAIGGIGKWLENKNQRKPSAAN